MIVSEIYETMAGDLYGVVLNEDIKIIRVVKINDRELTPDFFRRAGTAGRERLPGTA